MIISAKLIRNNKSFCKGISGSCRKLHVVIGNKGHEINYHFAGAMRTKFFISFIPKIMLLRRSSLKDYTINAELFGSYHYGYHIHNVSALVHMINHEK